MILVVSTEQDIHASEVLKILNAQGRPVTLLDLSEFPQNLALTIGFDKTAQRRSAILHGTNLGTLDLSTCGVIWWRRPQPFVLHDTVTRSSHRAFAYSESAEAWAGLWPLLDVFWVNHPVKTDVAGRKLFQLRVAQEAGLEIPDTCVSNDPQQVCAFVETHGADKTIYKTFAGTWSAWRETRLLGQSGLELIDHVQYAPTIFQEFIEAVCDLRITVIGDKLFPAAIYPQETAYKYDFRMDIVNARIEAVDLPREVTERLLALMAQLGLVYGAIDMRLTPDGRYVFLEINPAGEWLFIEKASGQPISQALADLLAAQDDKHLAQ